MRNTHAFGYLVKRYQKKKPMRTDKCPLCQQQQQRHRARKHCVLFMRSLPSCISFSNISVRDCMLTHVCISDATHAYIVTGVQSVSHMLSAQHTNKLTLSTQPSFYHNMLPSHSYNTAFFYSNKWTRTYQQLWNLLFSLQSHWMDAFAHKATPCVYVHSISVAAKQKVMSFEYGESGTKQLTAGRQKLKEQTNDCQIYCELWIHFVYVCVCVYVCMSVLTIEKSMWALFHWISQLLRIIHNIYTEHFRFVWVSVVACILPTFGLRLRFVVRSFIIRNEFDMNSCSSYVLFNRFLHLSFRSSASAGVCVWISSGRMCMPYYGCGLLFYTCLCLNFQMIHSRNVQFIGNSIDCYSIASKPCRLNYFDKLSAILNAMERERQDNSTGQNA